MRGASRFFRHAAMVSKNAVRGPRYKKIGRGGLPKDDINRPQQFYLKLEHLT
jgi:hypothetical protein